MKNLFVLLTLLTSTLACSLVTPPAPPELSISSDPAAVTAYSAVSLHIHARNTSTTDWANCSLLIGYAKAGGDESMVAINQVPVNLPAGQSLDQDIPWQAEIHDPAGAYEWRLVLVDANNIQKAAAKTPFELSQPAISVKVTPAELNASTPAMIHVEVNNPGTGQQNVKPGVLVTKQGEGSGILIREIPVTFAEGAPFTTDFEWISDIPLMDGVYDVQAVLLTDPGAVQIQYTSVSVAVKN